MVIKLKLRCVRNGFFNLGDDSCLFDADAGSNCSNDDGQADFQKDSDAVNNVDVLVDNIVKDLIVDENNILPNQSDEATVEHVSSDCEVGGGASGYAPSAVSGSE
jgi:hypothetical protein